MFTAPLPPTDWVGSTPEWAIYWALTQLGLKPNEDFTYQSPQAGGRLEYGGAVLDFLLPARNLGINVQSIYFHYRTVESRGHDMMIRAMMEGMGITVIYIDEEDALRDPLFYTKEALAERDHSLMTRR